MREEAKYMVEVLTKTLHNLKRGSDSYSKVVNLINSYKKAF